ncbi:MAG: isoaspartyl peptidase/L-asparaginase family protein, partial [Polyangia bacterium]
MTAAIIVHGGAGAIEDARRARCIAGCEAAAAAGWALLDQGRSALDAVEAAVRALEDDAEFNAGYGAVLSRAGTIEVDACVMTGEGTVGAVGAVPWLRHPVTLARRVLEDGEHVLLVGDGALAFAREHGIAAESPATLVTPRARARFEQHEGEARKQMRTGDTVGACAVDGSGRVAAATSTGGIPWKRPGRVGDTPLPGAGTWAEAVGAASATGHGESIIRALMTRVAIDRLRAGATPDEAARAAVAELVRVGGDGGVIIVCRDGRVGHHTSTARMPWATIIGGARSSGAEAAPRGTPAPSGARKAAAPVIVRPARLDELSSLATAVATQELLVRYEITSTRLAQLLAEAIGRGEPMLVADEGGSARGFAWYLYSGTIGVGGYLRLIVLAPGAEGRGAGGALLDAVEADVATRARHLFL